MVLTHAERENALAIRRPQDGSPVGTVPVDGAAQVGAAVVRARRAQEGWSMLDPRERVRLLAGVREIIARRSDAIADRIVAETGKPEVEALTEVATVVSLCRHYEKRAPRLLLPRRVGSGWMLWKRSTILQQPYGVVAVISPWNYPFILSAEPTLTALFAGNGVVLKPSEYAPFTGAILAEVLGESDLPAGLVQVVQGDGETGSHLVDAGVDRIHFTGSARAGRAVLTRAARHLVPVSLELGGKDPAVVLDDADLERSARGIAFGAFFNAGQTCLATERVYVVEAVYEPFVRELRRAVSELRAGSAGRVDVGPLTTPEQLEVVESQLADAVELGARVLCGGDRVDPASNVFLPTILVDVTDEMLVMREETFGPLLPVISVADEEEAIRRAGELPMGLFASIWTGSPERGRAVGLRLPGGGFSVNDTLSHWANPALPMGGVGESGFGRVRGDEGLLSFSRSRSVLENRVQLKREPWWFPHRPIDRRLVRAVTAWEGERGVRRISGVVKAFLGRGEA